jgi:hypothetical protein
MYDRPEHCLAFTLSLALFGLTATMLGVWTIWAVVGATTGWGKLSYAGVGLISPTVGGVLGFVSLLVLVRLRQVGAPKRYAAGALLLSLVFAIVPLVTFLAICNNCIT